MCSNRVGLIGHTNKAGSVFALLGTASSAINPAPLHVVHENPFSHREILSPQLKRKDLSHVNYPWTTYYEIHTMANRIPCYYLAPTGDFPPPPAGSVKLGSVITNLNTPDRPLFTATLSAGTDLGQIFSTEQRHVTYSTDELRQGQLGIFARFLGLIIRVTVEATVDWKKA